MSFKHCLALFLVSLFCLGQMCGEQMPIAESGSIILQQGIPEGLYIGQVSQTISLTVASLEGEETEFATDSFTLTVDFHTSGLPETVQGSAIAPGDTKTVNMGPFSMTGVVSWVSVDVGKAQVYWTAAMYITEPDGTIVELTGYSSDIYEYQSEGTVNYSTTSDLLSGILSGGEYLLCQTDSTGLLMR